MGGAKDLNPEWLKGRKFINLDSEDLFVITYGSAGGMNSTFEYIPTSQDKGDYAVAVGLEISGLTGGHSGININEGRANAIKLMADALFKLKMAYQYDFHIIAFESGVKTNAIPNKVAAGIAVADDVTAGKLVNDFNFLCEAFKNLHKQTDPNFKYVSGISKLAFKRIFTEASTSDLIGILIDIPNGIINMINQRPGIVDTSSNLAIVNASHEKVKINCSHRSASDKSLDAIARMHASISEIFNIELGFTQGDRYPSWQPDKNSELLKLAEDVYKDKKAYGDKAKSDIIHAGLECSWLIEKYKHDKKPMDCIAIGPTITDPHTQQEKLTLKDTTTGLEYIQSFYKCVIEIIKKVQGNLTRS